MPHYSKSVPMAIRATPVTRAEMDQRNAAIKAEKAKREADAEAWIAEVRARKAVHR
jgi:hypothetical protein